MENSKGIVSKLTILVTGGTGFLGSRLAEELVRKDYVGKIILGGRSVKPASKLIHSKISYQLGDLKDPAYLSLLFRKQAIDVVVNCVSKTSIWGKYDVFYKENVETQQRLLNLCEKHQVKRFIYISSPAIYFNFKEQLNVTEEYPLPKRFANNYARTKHEAEQLLKSCKIPYIIIRPRAYTGRGDTVMMPKVIQAARDKKLSIIGNGKNVVDICPVANIVDAIVLSIEAPLSACNLAYNIGYGKPIVIWQAISTILIKLGYEPPRKKIPYWFVYSIVTIMESILTFFKIEKEPRFTRYSIASLAKSVTFDISLARKNLGYEPRMSIEEAIEEFVNWYALQQEGNIFKGQREESITDHIDENLQSKTLTEFSDNS